MRPQPRAASLRSVLSILKYAEYLGEYKRSSDVRISTIAVTASHMLKSEIDRGKYICFTLESRCIGLQSDRLREQELFGQ